MSDKRKPAGKKLIFLILLIVILLTAFLIYKFYGDQIAVLWQLLRTGNQHELEEYLNAQDQIGGYSLLFILQVLQVISIFFPGMVIQIAGAMIYGWWKSFLICWIGFVFGNALVFGVARVFGKSLAFAFDDHDKKNNWLIEKINDGNQVFVVAIACLVPGIPNGIIPYLASRTSISLKDFALAVAGSSWIQIVLNCIAGHFLSRGEYLFMVFAFALQIALIVVITKNRDKLLKKGNK
ncbi:MAG: VTT domain-containing protein [Erysipelotrichaceae bacterium]|nr:VTT domain-containing protein [Erysipelotrichaceae bacterium]